MLCNYVAKKILLVNAVAVLLLRILFWQADFPHIKIERWVSKEIPKEKQKQGFAGGSVVKTMQKTQDESLIREDPTCYRATRPGATTAEPVF